MTRWLLRIAFFSYLFLLALSSFLYFPNLSNATRAATADSLMLLGFFGISPGVALFDVHGSNMPWIQRDCIVLTGADGAILFQTLDSCNNRPIRSHLSPLEMMVRRLLSNSLNYEGRGLETKKDLIEKNSANLLARVHEVFCQNIEMGLHSLAWRQWIEKPTEKINWHPQDTLQSQYDCEKHELVGTNWSVFY